MNYITAKDIFEFSTINISQGQDLFVAGFPNGYMDKKSLAPALQKCNAASNLKHDVDDWPTFVINLPVFGGASGSPVFLVYRQGSSVSIHNYEVRLLGIVYENLARVRKIKGIPEEEIEIPVLGYAFKASLLGSENLRVQFETWVGSRVQAHEQAKLNQILENEVKLPLNFKKPRL